MNLDKLSPCRSSQQWTIFCVALITLISFVSIRTITGQSCMQGCTDSDGYFKKNCTQGLYLGDECPSSDDSLYEFCVTPYARCMDGKCQCLPNFVPKNITYGKPAMCVPEKPRKEKPYSKDICRYDRTNKTQESLQVTVRIPEKRNKFWEELILPPKFACSIGCKPDKKKRAASIKRSQHEIIFANAGSNRYKYDSDEKKRRRSKRETDYVLPATVVNKCDDGLFCYQIGPSAFGACRKASCPVGRPQSMSQCEIGNDDSCPKGYYCHKAGALRFDKEEKKFIEAAMCCPSVCINGYYKNGRCYRDPVCLNKIDGCEDRCEYEPCRFMVNPCENYGTCMVPKAGMKDFFWCKCMEGHSGRVCEHEGNTINRPTEDRRIECTDSLCAPPPQPVAQISVPVVPVSRPVVPTPVGVIPQPPPPPPTLYISPLLTSGAAAAQSSINSVKQETVRIQSSQQPVITQPLESVPATPARRTQDNIPCRANLRNDCEYRAYHGQCTTNRDLMVEQCDCACTKLILYGRAALAASLNSQYTSIN